MFDGRTVGKLVLAVLATVVLATGPGRAAPAAAATQAEAAQGQGEDKSTAFIDLPRRWDLSIYTLVVFALLFGLLYKFAWPNIAAGLQKREEMLSAVKTAAEAARAEAEEARARLQAEFASAHDKVRLMLEEARRDADALRAKEREAGQREAAAERDRAKREIESAKDTALQEIYQQSVELATLISSKAVRRSMSADDHRRLVDEALGELKNSPRG
jgi:F-type H+-transporting ATPase subunit b